MDLHFQAISEPRPGEKWRALFDRHWSVYRDWFLAEGDAARPSYLECQRQLKTYMPELLPIYERLCELADGSDTASRFLSMYRPPPYLSGCSQAVWTGDQPFLVRNYDYSPSQLEGTLLHTSWSGRQVIAMSDCCWGVVDGFNDAGLAVSLTFGGRRVVGDGFGVTIVLRYVLEFCDSVSEAVAVLKRVPVHMTYNVTVLDKSGQFRTVFLSPDRDPVVRQSAATTNHQESVEWHQHARATASVERERFLFERLADPWETPQRFVQHFHFPPLFSHNYGHGFGTLYTTIYRPATGQMQVLWPDSGWHQSFRNFEEQSRRIKYHDQPAHPYIFPAVGVS